jgi:diguanylate cyclase (GGDEF)-like protein/PAS domain S-box-containing protein
MNPKQKSPMSSDEEVLTLIEVLHASSKRLEDLTGGEVDTVTSRDGLTILLRHAQEHLRANEATKQAAILNALPAHIALLDSEGLIISVNEAWRSFPDADPMQPGKNSIGFNYLDICDRASQDGVSEASLVAKGVRSILAREAPHFSIEYQPRPTTANRWFLLSVTPVADDCHRGAIVMYSDITEQRHGASERKLIEDALHAEKERAQVTLDSIGDAVVCTDVDGNITFLNSVAGMMMGCSMQEVFGKPVEKVLLISNAVSHIAIKNPMKYAVGLDQNTHLPPNCVLTQRGGLITPIEGSASPIHDRGAAVTGAVIVFRDVSAVRAIALQMAHSANHDFLTGLPNRLFFSERVAHSIALAARHKKKSALLFLDLDGFKRINDSLGHPVGDKLLKSVAARLMDCVRVSDTVSRQGGDEFVVLLSEVENVEDAAITARKMLAAVAKTHSIDHHDLHVTTSIGVSVYPDDGVNAETLIKNADTAMYQAKENGRQNYQFFDSTMNLRAVNRQTIEESLRLASERKEFALHYQPKVDLKTGKMAGAEALLRWTHPTRGPVPPEQFIPVAEDCGLISSIGAWVIDAACQQIREWETNGLGRIRVAVNVSVRQIREEKFITQVADAVRDHGIDPELLEFEITESTLMAHGESTSITLRKLKELGISISIDDFGTGYSNLAYLKRFPVDALKIDIAFIRDLATNADDAAITAAIINMAHSLRLKVIAEGVETREQLDFLSVHGCDEVQGYLFSRPLPASEIPAMFIQDLRNSSEPRTALFSKNTKVVHA